MIIDHPLIEGLRKIQEEAKTGFLLLEKENREIILCFRNGLIDGAASDIVELRLGNVLSRKGVFESSAVAKLLEKARRKHMMTGEAAVYFKLLDDAGLNEGVHDQIIHAVSYALANEFQVGLFDESPVKLYMPAKLDVDRLILELARRNFHPIQFDPNNMLCLNNGQSLSRFPWYPQELSVLSQLKTPRNLRDLAAFTGMEYVRLNKILSVFDSLKLLKQVEAEPSESTALIKRDGFPFEFLISEIGSSGLSGKLETFHNPTSFISEQFKTLKVRLAEAAAQAPLRVIAISSPHTEDGKSLISLNLAISLAKDSGRRVALVDCDLRNPSIHKFLGTSIEPGLLGYLEGDLQAYCYLRRLQKLYLMTAGGTAENPVELLSGARMLELITSLKTEFNTVILDCPPFGPISDAQILTGLADGFLMVVRCGKTTYGTMEKAFNILDRSKLIGLVFNDVKPMMFNTKYHYKYYHYRSYYPYGAVKPTPHSKTYLE
jgi:capsular exopolysaccharide synthesis family protein